MIRPRTLAATLLFLACLAAHAADPTKVLRIASDDIDTLDPIQLQDKYSNDIASVIFEGLCEWDYLNRPPGPVPSTNKTQLELEISGDSTAAADAPIGPPFPAGIVAAVPNLVQTVGAYSVVGDIDFLYRKQRAGSGQQFGSAYDGTGVGGGAGGVDMFYRVDCVATNTATGMSSRISAIYSCLFNDGCTRKLS